MSRSDRSGVATDSCTSLASAKHAGTPQRSAPPQSCYDGDMVAQALPRSRPRTAFNGVKVFSATKFVERDALGERVTRWLREHPGYEIVDKIVTQSSDAEFHCVTISLFYLEGDPTAR